jgi:hypothetical protein
VTFYGHNDVSSSYTAIGNIILLSLSLASCACDAVLLEMASDSSFGATACVCGNRSGKRVVWPQLRIRAFVSLPCSPMKFICKWLA